MEVRNKISQKARRKLVPRLMFVEVASDDKDFEGFSARNEKKKNPISQILDMAKICFCRYFCSTNRNTCTLAIKIILHLN